MMPIIVTRITWIVTFTCLCYCIFGPWNFSPGEVFVRGKTTHSLSKEPGDLASLNDEELEIEVECRGMDRHGDWDNLRKELSQQLAKRVQAQRKYEKGSDEFLENMIATWTMKSRMAKHAVEKDGEDQTARAEVKQNLLLLGAARDVKANRELAKNQERNAKFIDYFLISLLVAIGASIQTIVELLHRRPAERQ